ncbi:MAG TPA: beta-N-acetylhexosaminidase [Candidatus Acidoferrum sp.]|nr:beta-N-acetylhexosaminidase [Candidatus Acidoferrum sp.]
MKRELKLVCTLIACFPALAALAAAPALIPLPQQMQVRPGVFTLCPTQAVPGLPIHSTTRILVDSASLDTGQYLAATLLKSTGCQFDIKTNAAGLPVRGAMLLTTVNADARLGGEGYELTVAPDSVVIRAPASAGVFYGVQTLLQLMPPQVFSPRPVSGVAWTVPCVYIKDQPRFAWRGWMLDVVRHFFNKQEIKQVLDAMALHKLNTFHWHLVDDQGWRIEILSYPLLTQVGAWRNGIDWSPYLNPRASTAWNASGQYGGYYTQADIREIVAYAAQRHITIVPEIEMPGHSTAGVASYPQYSCNPTYAYSMDNINYTYDVYSPGTSGTFTFLENILTEVIGLFPGQYIHTGGDEVTSSIWLSYSADKTKMQQLGLTTVKQYQSWFSTQIANWLQAHGRTMIGWSEIEYGGILTNAVCMDWITGSGSEAVPTASASQYVVMTPTSNCYFDYYQNTGVTWSNEPPAIGNYIPLSTVYNLEPVPSSLPSQYNSYILGAQGNQWCEYVPSLLNVEFKSYPRLCAMAELTWVQATQKNYTDFTARLATHQQRLTRMGVNYDPSATPLILGTWTASQITSSSSYFTMDWDASTQLTNAGEVDVCFCWKTGAYGLDIQWTALLENGVEIDRDTHTGFTGSSPSFPLYVLRLPFRKAGATYTIRASVKGDGGTASNGTVYLPNWD